MFANLTNLNCSDNPLTSLDVSVFPELIELNCANCFNKSSQSRSYENGVLDLSANTKLQALSCGNNGLRELILPDSPLKNIYCNNNQLKSLDLSKNESLEFVNCEYNDASFTNAFLDQYTCSVITRIYEFFSVLYTPISHNLL